MHATAAFNLVLVSLVAIIALVVLAKQLRLPPAAALLVVRRSDGVCSRLAPFRTRS